MMVLTHVTYLNRLSYVQTFSYFHGMLRLSPATGKFFYFQPNLFSGTVWPVWTNSCLQLLNRRQENPIFPSLKPVMCCY